MALKVIVFFALLAVAFGEKPYVGLRVPKFDWTQVVGGSEAPRDGHPHIASLEWGYTEDSTSLFCACSILNENWVITAAHCPQAIEGMGGVFVIKAGKHDITVTESTQQTVRVAKSFVHDKYGGGVGPYDIALLKLKSPLTLTKEVQPINLPEAGSEPSGTPILIGWGSTSQSSIPSMPSKIQQVIVEYVDIQKCSQAVRDLTGSSPVHETNVCTGPLSGGVSACSGDSGGPLFEKNSNGNVLTGIVSWGIIPCGTRGAPSVFTKASAHIGWINDIMKNN